MSHHVILTPPDTEPGLDNTGICQFGCEPAAYSCADYFHGRGWAVTLILDAPFDFPEDNPSRLIGQQYMQIVLGSILN